MVTKLACSSIVFACLCGVSACPDSESEPGTSDVVVDESVDTVEGTTDAAHTTATQDIATDDATQDTPEVGGPDVTGDVVPFNQIQAGVHKLGSLLMGASSGDLQVLGDAIGTARAVGLGEAYHLSGGYHRAKARMVEYLVEERGFRAITLESPWGEAQSVDAYLQSDCSGSAEAVVTAGLSVLWHSQSMAALVEWLCTYNQLNPTDPVHFFGLDISQPEYDIPALNAFATATAAPDAATWAADLARCEQRYRINPAPILDAADNTACLAVIDTIEAYLDANAPAIATSVTVEELQRARASAISLRASQERMALDYAPSQYPVAWAARDAGMHGIINTLWPLYAADAKLIVLAANSHVAKAWQDVTLPMMGGMTFGTQSVGSRLASDLGADYVTVALSSYTTQTVDGPQPTMSDPEAVDVILHELSEPYLLVDSSAATDLFEPSKSYLLGTSQLTYGSVPVEQYNLLLFLESSDALTFLQ